MGDGRGTPSILLLLAALLVATAGATTASCGSTSGKANEASGATPKQGGTYNCPFGDVLPFDPALPRPGDPVAHELYEGLIRWEEQADGTLKTAPCLAESWSANADATVWTFRLRRGVMFQAPVSREVTAADVVADVRYLADSRKKSELGYLLTEIKGTNPDGYARPASLGVTALDRYTVRFTLKYPFSEFADTLGAQPFWIWPRNYLEKVGLKAYAQHPVGTGPYQFLRWLPGKSLDLERNPHWWDTSGGPYIDTIHFEVFRDISTCFLAFQQGRIDESGVPEGQVAASRSLPQVKSGQWRADTTPILWLVYLCFNMKDPVLGGSRGLSLRQALTYGCDRQAVIDALSTGVDQLPTGLVPPAVPGSDLAQEPYPYDPAKAKELIGQTGPVTLHLSYSIDLFDYPHFVAPLVASYAKLGITVKPRWLHNDRYWALVNAGKCQMYLEVVAADYPSMDNFIDAFKSYQPSYSTGNIGTSYSNASVDALLTKARATPEEGARVQLYAQAERRILADAPVVTLLVIADYRLMNSRVANVKFNSMGWADLWRAWVK